MAVTGQQVDDPLRHSRLVDQPVEEQCRQRGLLGGFDEQAAAGGQRGRKLGAGIEDRAVPREDQTHHAVGLFEGVRVHVDIRVTGDAVGLHVVCGAVDLRTPAGVVAEEFRDGRHLQLRLHQRHAGVERVELGELLGVFIDQIPDAPQHLGPLAARQLRPDAGLEGSLGPRDRLVDRLFATVVELGDHLFGRRIDDRNDITRA